MSVHNNRGKTVVLRELGFADPVKMITARPAILGCAIDNVRSKIANLRQLGFPDPVKMITWTPAILTTQNRRPARARLRRPRENDHCEAGDPGVRDR